MFSHREFGWPPSLADTPAHLPFRVVVALSEFTSLEPPRWFNLAALGVGLLGTDLPSVLEIAFWHPHWHNSEFERYVDADLDPSARERFSDRPPA